MPRSDGDTYIALFRKLLVDPIWTEYTPVHRDLWIAILLRASYQDGSLETTASTMAEWVSYKERRRIKTPSRKTILEVLRVFSAKQMIALCVKRDGIELTVLKWDTYQQTERKCETQKKHSAKHTGNAELYYNEPAKEVLKKEALKKETNTKTKTWTPGASDKPISLLGDMLVEMGLPGEKRTYSWIGGLVKKFGEKICGEFLSAEQLKGTNVADFENARAMRSYFTKAIQNTGNGTPKIKFLPPLPEDY